MPKQTALEALAATLEKTLFDRYGAMLRSGELWKELGYRSPSAFRQAIGRGKLDLALFELPGRRGKFALAKDVAYWIASHRLKEPTLIDKQD
jgi:hypothetical protein